MCLGMCPHAQTWAIKNGAFQKTMLIDTCPTNGIIQAWFTRAGYHALAWKSWLQRTSKSLQEPTVSKVKLLSLLLCEIQLVSKPQREATTLYDPNPFTKTSFRPSMMPAYRDDFQPLDTAYGERSQGSRWAMSCRWLSFSEFDCRLVASDCPNMPKPFSFIHQRRPCFEWKVWCFIHPLVPTLQPFLGHLKKSDLRLWMPSLPSLGRNLATSAESLPRK